ncbi:MAG: M23 family metallopeptidase [Pseudomonadota bacterium]
MFDGFNTDDARKRRSDGPVIVGEIPNQPATARYPEQPVVVEQAPLGSVGTTASATPRNAGHLVRTGDTVYSIARRYGSTPAAIQRANGLDAAFTIKPGQMLRIPGSAPISAGPSNVRTASTGAASLPEPATLAPANTSSSAGRATNGTPLPPSAADPLPEPVREARELASPNLRQYRSDTKKTRLMRPVDGEIVARFGARTVGTPNEGIDLRSPPGSTVRAAESGQVSFVSPGRGPLGQVVLVQHPSGLMTVYGRVANVRVAQGQKVARGDKLAEIAPAPPGEEPRLHFELRKGRQPIDPTPYL